MTSLYINLDRRFAELSDKELEDPDSLAVLAEHRLGGTHGWEELLTGQRVVLLAEAGAGKTREMSEQAVRLRSQGKYAFFLPLEGLHRESLAALLSADVEKEFAAWKSSSAPAWFFLDAVDELKLTEGKLERALQRLAKELDGQIMRTHVVVSCRPHDWRPNFDLATFRRLLPLPDAVSERIVPAEEAFLAPLRRTNEIPGVAKAERSASEFKTVILLPLSTKQISTFAQESGVSDTQAFLSELQRQDAWIFARRPFDLIELLQTWSAEGRLGTRAEQHFANVRHRLRDDPERPDQGVLSDDKAQRGAKRLALALALTRTRTIQSPDQSAGGARLDGALDPAAILCDWTPKERATLLRRGLFDPATYGRVRFHHRSVQEFLAAQRLTELRQSGFSVRSVFRLFFAERYGASVVLPSMRPIAAWMSLWDADVRRELMEREPEALLTLGDPESLAIADRAHLLKTFATMYGSGGRRGLNIPISEVRRLSHPNLASTVRCVWGRGSDEDPANYDLRELLIETIWKGPIAACADLAERAARNTAWEPYHRIAAVRALVACERADVLRSIANSMLKDRKSWPGRVVYGVASQLFPNILSVRELITLIRRTPEPTKSIGGFSEALREIVESIEPFSSTAVELRTAVAALILNGHKGQKQEAHHLRSKYGHLSRALAILCARQLASSTLVATRGLIDACVTAFRFRNRYEVDDIQRHLQTQFGKSGAPRDTAFWIDLHLMDSVVPAKDDWHRTHNAANQSLLGGLTLGDKPWLIKALKASSRPDHHPVALHLLIDLWYGSGSLPTDLKNLAAIISGNAPLEKVLSERTADTGQKEYFEKERRDARRRESEGRKKEERRLDNWARWRDSLIANPSAEFSGNKADSTIINLYRWLDHNSHEGSRFSTWNKDLVVRAFSPAVAAAAEKAFIELWRKTHPNLWSARVPEERSSTPWSWIYGLCGLAAESSLPNWTRGLTSEDAKVASAYARVELNGLAPFIADLATAFPMEVEQVLGNELSAQLSIGADSTYLPMLQDLVHADLSVKILMKPRLLATLPKWPRRIKPESANRWAHHLDQVLRVLLEICDASESVAVAAQCTARYESNTVSPLAIVWLKALFARDPQKAADLLVSGLGKGTSKTRKKRAIHAFGTLFGEHDAVAVRIADAELRARVLGRLVRSVYEFVRHDDDKEHEGMYTPDIRDHAERARNFLLSALLETPGPVAQQTILALAKEPDFAHIPDRLVLLARERAAADAEFEPYTTQAIDALERHLELPPHDRDGIFELMMDRLRDLQHDLAHHDFSDRRTIRGIHEEIEMQRTLAMRLDAKANGAYSITREEEVADRKETDIRFLSKYSEQKAVAEVKIADDRWSLLDLERALEDQLLGQYLRHENCRAGCLLLTYDGSKQKWLHPTTKAVLTFADLVEHLSGRAQELEANNNHEVRLSIFGLDLTDPR